MTQIRPRIPDDLAAEVKAYGDTLRLNFETTVRVLLRQGLRTAPRDWPEIIAAMGPPAPTTGDDSGELHLHQRGPVRTEVRARVARR